MKPDSDKRWKRFLEYAALARAKPTFDAEERDWRLLIAERMQEVLEAARDDGDWLALLNTAYRQGGLFRFISSTRSHKVWFDACAAGDPDAARRALAAFLNPADEAEERFASFARTLEEAEAKGRLTVETTPALTLGSVCNFAVEPLSLPMMRPGFFRTLAQILGYEQPESESIADAYAEHLAFARWLRSRMEESGFPVRDMIDVHGLIFIAVHERDFWAGDRLYSIGVPAPRPEPDPRDEGPDARPYLSVCAGYRNEARYLPEWIEFHLLVGVEHFFLYDAHSTDNHEEVLAPYVEEGIVTTHDWEGISHEQADTYNECLREHREDSRWIAFFDCDEFLFSPTGKSLPEVLVEYEGWPGVGVNWALFGRSGHATRPPGLVLENYVMRSETPSNMFTKNIVDPARVARCVSGHQFAYRSLLAVNENHYPIHATHTKFVSSARLRVNHYVTKSEEECQAKLGRPKAWDDSRIWRATKIEYTRPRELDMTITNYIPALRAALARRSEAARTTVDRPR